MTSAVTQPAKPDEAPWAVSAEALLASLETRREGLEPEAARSRLARFGRNVIRDARQASGATLLLRQFESPLALILIFAALVAAGLRDWLESGIILVIVLGSVLLGFAQEYRASAAVAALRRRLTLTARVRRAGEVIAIAFAEIVPGDIVLLSAGAVVPADARVLDAQDLLVSEAVLTGESFPVEKRPGVCPPDAPLAARTNSVFLGTSVRSGTAEVVVVSTGLRTAFGDIARRLRSQPDETEFARSMRLFGLMLIRIMVAVVLFVLTVNQLLGRPFIDSLLFAVALGVGMSPEFLPAVISVTLSAGARRLAANGVLVRRLEAIENLGGMTVFCTDKTGTLTEGAIRLDGAFDAEGRPSHEVAQLALVNAAFETGIVNPLDEAIRAAGTQAGLVTDGYLKVDEIPYDFSRKRLTIVVQAPEAPDARLVITKGAFDNVAALCPSWRTREGDAPLDGGARAQIDAFYRARGEEGLRVLAVATRTLPIRPDYVIADEIDMCFRGFLVFMDPLKPDAASAVDNLARRGVAVKIVSGDNRHVVAHVAKGLGLDAGAMLTGDRLAQMKDEALWNLAPRTTLFAEVDPQQKERIIRALQHAGEAVGYLGDGVNDAPALAAADVGVSVDQAVDVARETADVVLLKRDLDVLRLGVEGGRRTFANTLKYICLTTSANFGNMLSMAVAAPVLPFLPMAAKQILLNNFLSDLPAIALATDRVEEAQIATPQRLGVGDIQRFMVIFGLISSLFDLITFALLLRVLHAREAVFQTSWFVLSLLTELAVVLVLRTQGPAWRSRPGGLLLGITAAVVVVALATPYLGPPSSIFGFVPLAAEDVAALLLVVAAYVAATELGKRWFFAHLRKIRNRGHGSGPAPPPRPQFGRGFRSNAARSAERT